MDKMYLTAKDISEDLGADMKTAAGLIDSLNSIILADGYIVPNKSNIIKLYYEKAKEKNFLIRPERLEIPIEERLWWSLEEFVQMCAGAMSRDRAKKHLEEIGLLSWNGNKQIVNRLAYEEWCRENSSVII